MNKKIVAPSKGRCGFYSFFLWFLFFFFSTGKQPHHYIGRCGAGTRQTYDTHVSSSSYDTHVSSSSYDIGRCGAGTRQTY